MKRLVACALLLAAAFGAAAQSTVQAPDEGAERERIRAERAAVEARFAQEQRACRAKFAVNDCEAKARRVRNDALADLRRQEIVLNDAERRRRAAERLQSIEERNSPEKREAAERRRQEALSQQQERERQAADKAARRAADEAKRAQQPSREKTAPGQPGPQGGPRQPALPKPNGPTAREAAENRAAWERRVKEAEEHKAQVRAKLAKRAQPPASALPTPP